MTTDGPSLPQRDELRALAEAAQNVIDPAWPRRAIQQHGACDGCALTRPLVAAYDDPDRESEPWLCRECADEADFRDATSPDVILALLDDLDLLAARRDDLAEKVALCSQCGERPSCMVKVGTADGWCEVCLNDAADTERRVRLHRGRPARQAPGPIPTPRSYAMSLTYDRIAEIRDEALIASVVIDADELLELLERIDRGRELAATAAYEEREHERDPQPIPKIFEARASLGRAIQEALSWGWTNGVVGSDENR